MSETAAYTSGKGRKIKRVWLAVFLCGIAACVIVTVIGAGVMLLFSVMSGLVGTQPSLDTWQSAGEAFFGGMAAATLAATFNGFVFYITIPAATLALALSIGRFPKRRIARAAPYLRWGAIWGAVLVTLGASFVGLAIVGAEADHPVAVLAGAVLMGSVIGALAGVACAALFLLIVRPAGQIQEVDASVF